MLTPKSTRLLSTVLLTLAGCAPAVEEQSLIDPPSNTQCKDGNCAALLAGPCQVSPSWDIVQFGSTQDDVATGVATDAQCNVYIAGTTRGLVEPRTPSSQPGQMQDIFLARVPANVWENLDPSKSWVAQLGSEGDDSAKDLVVSAAGDAYLVGGTSGLMPGETELTGPLGFNDVFATRFGSNGVRQWTRQYGSVEEEVGLSATLTRSDELLIAGASQENFDSGFEVTLDKLSLDGQVLDHRLYGTSSHDRGEGIWVDAAGNILLAGSTLGDFDGPNQGSTDVFLSQVVAPDQKVDWTSQRGTSDIDAALEVVGDSAGNIYVLAVSYSDLVSGRFENDGIQNSFLIKYPAGSQVPEWTYRIGSSRESNRSTGLAVDENGFVYVAGFTTGSMEYGKRFGGRDAFVAMFASDGWMLWSKQLGTAGNDEAQDVVILPSGDIVISGYTSGDLTGLGQHQGRQDAFVARFSAPFAQ